MKTLRLYLLLLVGVTLTPGCEYGELGEGELLQKSEDKKTPSAPQEPILTVTPRSFSFGPMDKSKSLSITSNGEWFITTNRDWCHASKINGSGNDIVVFTCDENTSGMERKDTICVNLKNDVLKELIPIVQSSTEKYLSTSVESLDFDSKGETIKFQVLTNTTWNIKASNSWCQVSPNSGTGEQEIAVTIARNPTSSARSASLTITSTDNGVNPVEVKITQEPGEDSDLTISEDGLTFASVGGTKTVQISSNITWNAVCTSDWCSVSPTTSITGNGEISIIVEPNPIMSPQRSAVIEIHSDLGVKTITVTQDKGESGYLTASISSINLDSNAQQTSFEVESNIEWSVSCDESWCTVTSNVSKLNGTVTVSVTKNTGTEARDANIILKSALKDVSVIVHQDILQVPGIDDNPNPNYSNK